jgi:hypothetical protein
MAKNVREQIRTPKTARVESHFIPPKYQHIAAMVFIYISLLVFFHAIIFDSKSYQSADSIAAHSWDTFRNDSQAEGIVPLWNPYIFCGMPGFASLTYPIPRIYDITSNLWEHVVRIALSYFFLEEGSNGAWLLYYLVFGIGVYLFVNYKLKSKPIALIVALMATYSMRVAVLIMIGHVTKIAVLAWFPFVFLLVEKLREKFTLFLAVLLTIAVRLMIQPGHMQFIFYIYLSLGAYLIFLFIRSLIKKENWKGILASGIILIFATVFAFLMGADQHLSTLEYNPYSMRGSNPITHTSAASQTKTIEGGLDYEYATSWSFSPGELMTLFIPSWYGFGDLTYQGPLTGDQPQKLNFYWGPQPDVDSPQYMGIIVIVLAVIGFIRYRKDPFVQFMGAASIVSIFIAFGKEFPVLYDIMYRYFPMFNKFRIPVMILMIVQFFTPILAGYGIISFVENRPKTLPPALEKKWKYTLGGLAFGVVISVIGASVVKSIYSSFFPVQEVAKALARSYGQLNPAVLSLFYDFVFSSIMTDLLIGFILLTIVFGAFYFFQKGKLKVSMLYGILVVLVLFDLWRIAGKPYDPKDKQESIQAMAAPDFVKTLLQDTTSFRVLRMMNGQPVYDNSLAYWRIQNAYGYQGAKMRIYQDMVDVAGLGNPRVWQLMNIKYLISNREESHAGLVPVYNGSGTKVYAFQSWLPRVFFVNRYEVSDNLSTLNKISAMSFDPKEVAYISRDIKTNIDAPLQGTEARIVHYGSQNIEIQTRTTGNNLLFISEAYYPKGWKASVDGKETEIFQLNYLFRGVVIPPGEHTLIMKFEPARFALGKTISLIANLIILCGIILILLFRFWVQRKKIVLSK